LQIQSKKSTLVPSSSSICWKPNTVDELFSSFKPVHGGDCGDSGGLSSYCEAPATAPPSPCDAWLQIDQLIHTNNNQLHLIKAAMNAMQADAVFSEAELARTAALLFQPTPLLAVSPPAVRDINSGGEEVNSWPPSKSPGSQGLTNNNNTAITVSFMSSYSSANTPTSLISSQNSAPSPPARPIVTENSDRVLGVSFYNSLRNDNYPLLPPQPLGYKMPTSLMLMDKLPASCLFSEPFSCSYNTTPTSTITATHLANTVKNAASSSNSSKNYSGIQKKQTYTNQYQTVSLS
jgi:hypothetical protein